MLSKSKFIPLFRLHAKVRTTPDPTSFTIKLIPHLNEAIQVIPQRLKFIDPVRLCTKCQQRSLWENDFFDKYLKKLKSGVELFLENSGGERVGAKVNLSNDCSLLQVKDCIARVRLSDVFLFLHIRQYNFMFKSFDLTHKLV